MISGKGTDDKMDGNTSNMLVIMVSQMLCSLMHHATAEALQLRSSSSGPSSLRISAVASFESNLHQVQVIKHIRLMP